MRRWLAPVGLAEVGRFLGLLSALMLGATDLAAETPTGKVVVVNSDAGIEKYKLAQQAFRESFPGEVSVVDIAHLTERQALRAIRAEAPTALYGIGAKASVAVTKASRGKPVVVSSVINWNRLPEVRSPGVHVVANELPSQTQLTLFRYFFPGVKRVGVLYSRDYNRQWLAGAVAAGKDVGIEVIGVPVRSSRSVDSGLAELLPKVDALWVASDPVVLADEASVRRLFAAIAAARKPSFTYASAFAEFGPTLIVAPDVPTIGRQAAGILKARGNGGAKEVQSPAGSEIILNLGAVRDYGLQLNEEARDSVNRFIR
jgi:putative ABC transport system substrate-binding protein